MAFASPAMNLHSRISRIVALLIANPLLGAGAVRLTDQDPVACQEQSIQQET
jgi:hypothetical protein